MEDQIGVDKTMPVYALESRDQQQQENEQIFARLERDYTNAARDRDALETALRAARSREHILGAAMQKLNEPQDAPPVPSRG